MKKSRKKAITKNAPARKPGKAKFNLRLYVAGKTPHSVAAVKNLKRLCASLGGQYRIEIIDLAKNPSLARDHNIIALPTLVRQLPSPIRKIIGNLSDVERVLVALDVNPAA